MNILEYSHLLKWVFQNLIKIIHQTCVEMAKVLRYLFID
jgi:hypothetical protein